MSSSSTIFALSSGRPPSAIAIVRVSGPAAGEAVRRLTGGVPAPRLARYATLRDSRGEPLDEAVVLWFPAPASATGEDVAEFHVHGGRAVLAAITDSLLKIDGLRPAEPGEFTRRAFENGKLDLTDAEGLDDLIHADTDHQRRQALRQLKGLLGDKAESWRRQIIEASALIEAGIDFSDEGDVPDDLTQPAFDKIIALRSAIEETLAASAQSERLRDGLVVAIAGAPNVGKSTLLNRLARREAAIVSPHAGTTRDVIEVHLDLDGYPVTLLDTAGIRETDDPVEQEGVRRARARAGDADLVLWLLDATSKSCDDREATLNAAVSAKGRAELWFVRNKVDATAATRSGMTFGHPRHDISAANGEGVAELVAALGRFADSFFGLGEGAVITRARHRALLRDTADGLDRATGLPDLPLELAAEELRAAIHSLGRLVGRVDVDDILDVIFREFCIGK
ncbi:MAG: tRNA uridine(34) 5-carboxymethylaminomethyl synthesis GTPase MnmE [Proteobacteria bacterium SG_bin9]|nr:MAG: tRNA uridine(34) 5-carboxymethylaminomethyl synthesis GTPase MnmE [Proteobacteria bacterium SG_bin9]